MNVPAVPRLIFLNNLKWPFLYSFLNYQYNAHFGNKHSLLDIRCLVYFLRFVTIIYKYTKKSLLQIRFWGKKRKQKLDFLLTSNRCI
jgi:hypothetical protein